MDRAEICVELQALARERADYLGFRIKNENGLRAKVASTLGYETDLDETARRRLFDEADKLIAQISKGSVDGPVAPLVRVVLPCIESFDRMAKNLEKETRRLAERLPVADWVEDEEQRGFGPLLLGQLIGETGDLANYPSPGKVWKRMGCAPFEKDGKNLMPSTWRSGREGKLDSADWQAIGYSPRRRSIAYLIGDCLQKGNKGGPYRRRFDEAKAAIAVEHPDYKPMRCHLHGMLLASKLLMRNLWDEWTRPSREGTPESDMVRAAVGSISSETLTATL